MCVVTPTYAPPAADGGDSDLPPGEPLEERRRSIGGRLAGALGALNPQRFTAGGGGGVPLSELKGKLLSRVGMYPGDSARYPLDVKVGAGGGEMLEQARWWLHALMAAWGKGGNSKGGRLHGLKVAAGGC
jgi:hypothetical protein